MLFREIWGHEISAPASSMCQHQWYPHVIMRGGVVFHTASLIKSHSKSSGAVYQNLRPLNLTRSRVSVTMLLSVAAVPTRSTSGFTKSTLMFWFQYCAKHSWDTDQILAASKVRNWGVVVVFVQNDWNVSFYLKACPHLTWSGGKWLTISLTFVAVSTLTVLAFLKTTVPNPPKSITVQ